MMSLTEIEEAIASYREADAVVRKGDDDPDAAAEARMEHAKAWDRVAAMEVPDIVTLYRGMLAAREEVESGKANLLKSLEVIHEMVGIIGTLTDEVSHPLMVIESGSNTDLATATKIMRGDWKDRPWDSPEESQPVDEEMEEILRISGVPIGSPAPMTPTQEEAIRQAGGEAWFGLSPTQDPTPEQEGTLAWGTDDTITLADPDPDDPRSVIHDMDPGEAEAALDEGMAVAFADDDGNIVQEEPVPEVGAAKVAQTSWKPISAMTNGLRGFLPGH